MRVILHYKSKNKMQTKYFDTIESAKSYADYMGIRNCRITRSDDNRRELLWVKLSHGTSANKWKKITEVEY